MDAAAGSISFLAFAGQLADGIRKIIEFCNDIKDAPKEVKDIVTSLQLLGLVLQGIETQTRTIPDQYHGAPNVIATIKHCQETFKELMDSASEIQKTLNQGSKIGSKLARVKVAWSKKKTTEILFKIEVTKTSVLLASSQIELFYLHRIHFQNQHNAASVLRLETHVASLSVTLSSLISQPATPVPSLVQPSTAGTQAATPASARTRKSKSRRKKTAPQDETRVVPCRRTEEKQVYGVVNIGLPYWICSTAFKIGLEKANQVWRITLQSQRTVPFCAFFRACMKADLKAMQVLIYAGHASVLDVDPDGQNAMNVSPKFYRYVEHG